MKGYFNNAAETANVLRTHSDGKLWLHTGDLGSIDRDGNIYLSGRLKRVIVRYNGMKVSPSNIERVILTHPAVSACCTVGKKDTVHSRGQVPAAFVVLEYHDDNTISELKALCSSELSESYLPATPYNRRAAIDAERQGRLPRAGTHSRGRGQKSIYLKLI